MSNDPFYRNPRQVRGAFVHTEPGEAGDILACPALWKAHVEYLLGYDRKDGRAHPSLTAWERDCLAIWAERPDHFLTRKQAAMFRRIVEAARNYDAAVARWEREGRRRG